MSIQQLVIQIEAKSGGIMAEYNTLDIIVLPTTPTQFDVNPASLALGILWGTSLLFLGLIAAFTGLGVGLVEVLGYVHTGYNPTIFGAFMGCVSGLVYGFIIGAVVFRLGNVFLTGGSDR